MGGWDHQGQLDWALLDDPGHRGIFQWLRDLNQLYCGRPALHRTDAVAAGFEWIECLDSQHSVIAFLRRAEGCQDLVFACNFTPVPQEDYRIGLPAIGRYREVLNSDAEIYGGGGVGNGGAVDSEAIACHVRWQSARLRLPPWGCWFSND